MGNEFAGAPEKILSSFLGQGEVFGRFSQLQKDGELSQFFGAEFMKQRGFKYYEYK